MAVSDELDEPTIDEVEGEQHPLVRLVRSRYETAKAWRRSGCNLMNASIDEWIQRMDRAYHKVHEAEEQQNNPLMRAYFGLIQLKVDATVAWGKNQFLNQRFTPFTLEPTPDADLPAHLRAQGIAAFKQTLMDKLASSGASPQMLIDPALNTVRMEVLPQLMKLLQVEKDRARSINYDIARRACNRHTRIIKDQFVEGDWADEFGSVMFDQVLYPYGAMALQRGETIKWGWDGNKHVRRSEDGPVFRHIDVRRAFHAPDSKSAQDGSYFIEEVVRSKADLYQLKENEGAMAEAIDELLVEAELGMMNSWLNDAENSLAGTSPDTGEDSDVITLRMEGEVLGSDLNEVPGIKCEDSDVISVTIEICGDKIIYFTARPYIESMRGYFSASYVRNTKSHAGISVGMKLWDRQLRLNRLDFYQQANEKMAHGPVIEQLQRAFQDEHFSFAPFTHVYSHPDATGERGLKFHQATPLWRQLYQQFFSQLQLADHESGIPAFAAYGTNAGPQAGTLGQDVMRHQAAAKGIQAWTENNDDRIIAPVVEVTYHDNLIYMKDPSIQSDARVHARGALGAVARELQATRITQALPQIIQGTQIPGKNGQPLVPTAVADQAMKAFINELGLVVDEGGADDPNTDYSQGALTEAQPGLDVPETDGRSPGVPAF